MRGPTGFFTINASICMLFERCPPKNRKRYLKQCIKYFNFRCKIQLDPLVVLHVTVATAPRKRRASSSRPASQRSGTDSLSVHQTVSFGCRLPAVQCFSLSLPREYSHGYAAYVTALYRILLQKTIVRRQPVI